MKKSRIGLVAASALTALAVGVSGLNAATAAVPSLTADQKAALKFMVQEEKLAFDLYTILGEQTGLKPMTRIAYSEYQHMTAVRTLLTRYGVNDPTVGLAQGEFVNSDLQALYDQLLAQGTNYFAAKQVGVAVETTDINDLSEILKTKLPTDLRVVFKNLRSASYNHLMAFSR